MKLHDSSSSGANRFSRCKVYSYSLSLLSLSHSPTHTQTHTCTHVHTRSCTHTHILSQASQSGKLEASQAEREAGQMWNSFQRASLFSRFSSELWRDYHADSPCFVRWGRGNVFGATGGCLAARVDKRAAGVNKAEKCTVVEALVRSWLDQSLMFTHLVTERDPVRKTSLLSRRK